MTGNRFKVVHIHKMTGVSGSEQHLRILLTGLDPARFEPVFMMLTTSSARIPAEYVHSLTDRGVRVAELRIRADLDPILLAGLASWLRRERPAVVHTHLIHADVHGTVAARLAHVPAVVSSKHNDDPFRRNPVVRAVESWLARRTDTIIAISSRVRDVILADGRIEPSKVVVIPYGYAPGAPTSPTRVRESLGVDSDAPLVIAVGRLVPQKGHDVLIRAFEAVSRNVPRAQLVIVGEGPSRAELERLAGSLGIGEVVHLVGQRDDALEFLRAATLVVHPSRWEGFGIVLLEAMSFAKPIVASAVSAIPEIIEHGRSGLLVPPDDPEMLGSAIRDALLSPDRDAMGFRGRQILETRFTISAMVEATQSVYERALDQRTAEA